VSAEALATKRAHKKRGERVPYSHGATERRPYPWEAPPHPVEVAHEVFQAWLTFALFDNARRGHLGVGLEEHRRASGEMLAALTDVAASNPHAWFPVRRTAEELVTVRPDNRMVGYPYTKLMVAIMDVDMAAALVVTTHERADALGIPREQRVYLRGRAYATDPFVVAEHETLWESPAMAAAAQEALRGAGASTDDVAHLDLYSCFASSLHFARDALGLAPGDDRPLTVTGGLPYHGGPGSGYLTHSIATMAEVLRADPGSLGLVSGVGMHMTKHSFGVYSTTPGPVARPDDAAIRDRMATHRAKTLTAEHEGPATVAAYSVVHARSGDPAWGLVVCDLPDGTRAYAKAFDQGFLEAAEREELVGAGVRLVSSAAETPMGEARVNVVEP
jgi:acetyl-CoA C-acetyltransferase